MTYIDAIVLGLVQGITEFIPISSSGHLVIFNQILDLKDVFVFDVLLNFGTLLALIIFYRQKIIKIIKRTFSGKEWMFILKLVIATVPAGVIGFLFSSQIEALNESIWVVITMLILLAIPMILFGSQNKNCDDREVEQSMSYKKSIITGLAQALALIPGTSRSGVTILAGLRQDLSAAKAAEFSFLLAIPIIAGASLATLLSSEGRDFVNNNLGAFIVGNVASFVAGILAISFLIKLLGLRGLKDFGYYRLGLAAILIILVVAGII